MSTKMEMANAQVSGFAKKRSVRSTLRKGKVLALALIAPLGGCGVNRVLPPPVTPHDYHDRHPVLLTDQPHVVDLFPSGGRGHVDYETTGRVREFVARYNQLGHGQITLLAPVGGRNETTNSVGMAKVRRALAAAGVRGNILAGTYPVTDPNLAAPIRLSFQSLTAKVGDRCGLWPRDLASGSSLDGWENQTYWNFGCAAQATLSAQVADPRDLATPRGETPADIEMRMRGINRVRNGQDPTTIWALKASSISNVGGQ